MATPTYTPIASITLASSASSVTFSSIPQDYRDLVLVIQGGIDNASTQGCEIFINGLDKTGSNVRMEGDGSSTSSSTSSNLFFLFGDDSNAILQFMDYSATDKHKTILTRSNIPSDKTVASALRKPITAAITSIELEEDGGSAWLTGSTFALYGIEA